MKNTTQNPLVNGLEKVSNLTLTENGALTNKSTLNDILDFFGSGGALRSRSEENIVSIFSKAFAQDKLLALKILFYFRDIRGGQGERRTFKIILNWLAKNYPDIVKKNIENIPFFGRFDDLYSLVDTPLEKDAFDYFQKQLEEDLINYKNNKPVSILAKWLKSENTSSGESRKLGNKTREAFNLSPKKYRKILSLLRKHIDVTEVKLCSKKWQYIEYQKVPSKAFQKYQNAFLKHDEVRYKQFLTSVEKGESKINASVIYPYEIIERVSMVDYNETKIKALDLAWKSMPNWLKGNNGNFLTISDTSGSMNGRPLFVSVSLAIYMAQHNTGPFKDVWINFSNDPTFQRLKGNNIVEIWNNIDRDNWDSSTNLQSAFDLILDTAKQYNVLEKDMPKALFVISDMEFNCGCHDNNNTNFEVIEKKYKKAGYVMPKIIWWNVNARNDNYPIREDDKGTMLVSGCSPSIFKSVMREESYDPMSTVMETVMVERYNRVLV